jgi:hypothetical protein
MDFAEENPPLSPFVKGGSYRSREENYRFRF